MLEIKKKTKQLKYFKYSTDKSYVGVFIKNNWKIMMLVKIKYIAYLQKIKIFCLLISLTILNVCGNDDSNTKREKTSTDNASSSSTEENNNNSSENSGSSSKEKEELIDIPVVITSSTGFSLVGESKSLSLVESIKVGRIYDIKLKVEGCQNGYSADFEFEKDPSSEENNSEETTNSIKAPLGRSSCLAKLDSFKMLLPGESSLTTFTPYQYHRRNHPLTVGTLYDNDSGSNASSAKTKEAKITSCDWKTKNGLVLSSLGAPIYKSSNDSTSQEADIDCNYNSIVFFKNSAKGSSDVLGANDVLKIEVTSQLSSEGKNSGDNTISSNDKISYSITALADGGSASTSTGNSGTTNSTTTLEPPPFTLQPAQTYTSQINSEYVSTIVLDIECNTTMKEADSNTSSGSNPEAIRCNHFISGLTSTASHMTSQLYSSAPATTPTVWQDTLNFYIIAKSTANSLGILNSDGVVTNINSLLPYRKLLFEDKYDDSNRSMGTNIAKANSSTLHQIISGQNAPFTTQRTNSSGSATSVEAQVAATSSTNIHLYTQGLIRPLRTSSNDVKTIYNRGGFRIVWHTKEDISSTTNSFALDFYLVLEMLDGNTASSASPLKSYKAFNVVIP